MISDLHVSAIQSDLFWEDIPQNLLAFGKKIESISGADLILLPEMFTTGFSNNSEELAEDMNGQTVTWMKNMAKAKKAVIAGSAIIRENKKVFNRFLWVFPSGKIEFYDKKHLFAMAGEHDHYTAGDSKQILSINGWKILPLVCYDLRFPVWSRRKEDAENDFDLIVFVASWPTPRINAWSTLLAARAIENQSYCIGVNRVGIDGIGIEYSGQSAIFDPLGIDLVKAKEGQASILQARLNKQKLNKLRSKLPFQKDADQFQIIA